MSDEIDFYIDTEYDNTDDFDCGFVVFNDYLKSHTHKDNAVFHYIINTENNELIAYFSLLASAVLFGTFDNFNSVPAIELKMFAVDRKYQKRNLNVRLVEDITDLMREYSLEYVGADVLVLYSVPEEKVVRMYENCGFRMLPKEYSMYKSYFSDGCVSMYKPLSK